MAKCTTCLKNEVMDTRWDKIKNFLIWRLFPETLKDLLNDRYTQGFSDGYVMGCDHTKKNQDNFMKMYEGKD